MRYYVLLLSVLFLIIGWTLFYHNFWIGQFFIALSAGCFVAYMLQFKKEGAFEQEE